MGQLFFEPTLKKAIQSLCAENHPSEGIVIRGKEADMKDLSCLTLGDKVTPSFTWSDVETRLTEMLSQWKYEKYVRDRALDFPTWQEQMDMQFWDQVNGTTTWKDAIAKVKADHPKA